MSQCGLSYPASPRALLFKKYCGIIHLFLRSMSALSLLLPLLPRKRIYQSRARPLLSESKTGREYPCLAGRADAEIWRQCQLEERLLMTQDLDFSDARKFQPGSHAGIVLVRLQNPGRVALFGLLSSIFRNHDVEAWKGCFVVLSETKIRIRRN